MREKIQRCQLPLLLCCVVLLLLSSAEGIYQQINTRDQNRNLLSHTHPSQLFSFPPHLSLSCSLLLALSRSLSLARSRPSSLLSLSRMGHIRTSMKKKMVEQGENHRKGGRVGGSQTPAVLVERACGYWQTPRLHRWQWVWQRRRGACRLGSTHPNSGIGKLADS